jgi:hypothetical protein
MWDSRRLTPVWASSYKDGFYMSYYGRAMCTPTDHQGNAGPRLRTTDLDKECKSLRRQTIHTRSFCKRCDSFPSPARQDTPPTPCGVNAPSVFPGRTHLTPRRKTRRQVGPTVVNLNFSAVIARNKEDMRLVDDELDVDRRTVVW